MKNSARILTTLVTCLALLLLLEPAVADLNLHNKQLELDGNLLEAETINLPSSLKLAKTFSSEIKLAEAIAVVELQKSHDAIQLNLPNLRLILKLNPVGNDINALLYLEKVAGIITEMITGGEVDEQDDQESTPTIESESEPEATIKPTAKGFAGVPYGDKDNCLTLNIARAPDVCIYIPENNENFFEQELFKQKPEELRSLMIDYGYVEGDSTRAVKADVDFSLRQNLFGDGLALVYLEKRKNFQVAREKIRAAEQQVILKAGKAYSELYYLRQIVAINQQLVEKFSQYLKKTTSRSQVGLFPEGELQNLELQYIAAKEKLQHYQDQLKQATAVFEMLINVSHQTMAKPFLPVVPEAYVDLKTHSAVIDNTQIIQAELELDYINKERSINPMHGYLSWDLYANLTVGWDFVRLQLGTGDVSLTSSFVLHPLKIITTMIKQKAINLKYYSEVIATNQLFKNLSLEIKKLWLQQKALTSALRIKKERQLLFAKTLQASREKYQNDGSKIEKMLAAELDYFGSVVAKLELENELTVITYQLYSRLNQLETVINRN